MYILHTARVELQPHTVTIKEISNNIGAESVDVQFYNTYCVLLSTMQVVDVRGRPRERGRRGEKTAVRMRTKQSAFACGAADPCSRRHLEPS